MQISADIHSPKNKTGKKHPQADSDNIYLGKNPSQQWIWEKERGQEIKVPRFSAHQYNLTFKWLLATLYDKTHFQSGKKRCQTDLDYQSWSYIQGHCNSG